jgi:hypothetical protein
MAQLQAPLMLLLAISFLFMCAEGRLVPTPCWQDPKCREDPHPPRQRAESTPEVVEPNRLVPTPCCCEDPHPLARDPTSTTEVVEPTTGLSPTPLSQDPNCCEDPRPPGLMKVQVHFEANRLVPIPCWQDPNCREDPHPPGHLASVEKEDV